MSDVSKLLAQGEWVVIAGLFDPLTATVAKRLRAAQDGRRVLAVVLDNRDGLLTAEARAVLVAALRGVSAVAVANDTSWRSAIPESSRVRVIEDFEGERQRSAEFAAFILSRQASHNE
ncbi:MAG: hypothetical protein JO091_06450 [Acidobacteriaceae bacterium]|nr:hypothetical protein [Acidobacteriaceae bacterium]